MTKILPKELTSYDLLKSLAVILMVADHVGHHFFPDEMWFRVAGRLCVPIWFFLIGYAKTTEIPKTYWMGGALMVMSAVVSGQFLLPLNILFTLILMRYFRYGVFVRAFYNAETLRGMFLILLFLTLPSAILVEYGAIGMMFVMMGHIVRYKKEVSERIRPLYLKLFVAAAFFSFFVTQGLLLPTVSVAQAWSMLAGFIAVSVILWNFKAHTFSDATRVMAPSFIALFQFMGRYTLEIYVVHVLIFRAVAMYLYPQTYGFMEWEVVPAGLLAIFST